MNVIFEVFPYLFGIMFVTIFIIFVSILLSSLARKKQDDASPRLTVSAQVVSRRTELLRSAGSRNMDMAIGTGRTDYYVTFQVESGDRMELAVSGEEYGLLREGDEGTLRFQGKRFLCFARSRENIEKSPEIR